MNIQPVNSSTNPNSPKIQSFGHDAAFWKSDYSNGKKVVVALTTAIGTAASLAILAKRSKYSLNPSKMFKNFKESYLAKVFYHDKEVIAIGAGSCLGGLAGGYIIDKNPQNRKAKRRETIMQIGNISIPILTVENFAKIGKRFGENYQSLFAIAGIVTGVYLANFLMNILSNRLFNSKAGTRGVKATDFSAHLDDMVLAASYISEASFIKLISRFIPFALMFAGNEVGSKKYHD